MITISHLKRKEKFKFKISASHFLVRICSHINANLTSVWVSPKGRNVQNENLFASDIYIWWMENSRKA